MPAQRLLRNLLAMAVIVVACPAALFGGALLGCTNNLLASECALSGIMISPFLLLGAGLVAGLLTRGWSGLGLMFVAIIIGMAALAVVAGLVGNPVPIDPFQGIIATIWFGFPVTIGWAFGRVVARLFATRE